MIDMLHQAANVLVVFSNELYLIHYLLYQDQTNPPFSSLPDDVIYLWLPVLADIKSITTVDDIKNDIPFINQNVNLNTFFGIATM